MKKNKLKFYTFVLILLLLPTMGLSCKVGQTKVSDLKKTTLTIWSVWEKNSDLNKIISDFTASHPNITINFKQFRYSEYEKQILTARANRKEPDIVFIHNTWVGNYLDKISPMPKTIESTVVSLEGTIKKEQVINKLSKKTPNLNFIKETYLPVVYGDVIRKSKKEGDQIYSLPLYVDSLVLFYNKDILNNAGIIDVPKTWNDIQQDVKLTTLQDTDGRIVQSGITMGTSNNVERYFDVLSLLMMQSGEKMIRDGVISFNSPQKGGGSLGAQALRFYTDFAFPGKEVYTWDKTMTNSIDEFASGKVAFTFGYSYHAERIKTKNPKLNFDIAKIPQISTESQKAVNYASYWTPVVFSTSAAKNEAWDFIIYATSPSVVDSFLKASKRPPAIKSYITKYEEDFTLLPFLEQALTAKSWYQGKNANASEESFKMMIDKIFATTEGEPNYEEAVNFAASQTRNSY
jgi:multiple sugar transport system substrate-binding protein